MKAVLRRMTEFFSARITTTDAGIYRKMPIHTIVIDGIFAEKLPILITEK
jgi:hypothetical protein